MYVGDNLREVNNNSYYNRQIKMPLLHLLCACLNENILHRLRSPCGSTDWGSSAAILEGAHC